MTAGNSTPLSDGASVVLLASEEWAKERDLPVLAYFVDGETAAVDYVHKREGLLMAPAYAVPRMLERNGLSLQDFDLYEIHEAFAAQVLCTLRAWEDETLLPRPARPRQAARRDRPREAQRQRRLARRRPPVRRDRRRASSPRWPRSCTSAAPGRGLISVCAAGGQGVVAILEGQGRTEHERPLHPAGQLAARASSSPRTSACRADGAEAPRARESRSTPARSSSGRRPGGRLGQAARSGCWAKSAAPRPGEVRQPGQARSSSTRPESPTRPS